VWFDSFHEAIIEKEKKKKLWLLLFAIYFAKNERISIMWSPCENSVTEWERLSLMYFEIMTGFVLSRW